MSYRSYSTRNSGRYNSPGTFVPATSGAGAPLGDDISMESIPPLRNNSFNKPISLNPSYNSGQNSQTYNSGQNNQNYNSGQNNQTYNSGQNNQMPPPIQPPMSQSDAEMTKLETSSVSSVEGAEWHKPYWMKSRLHGVKKITNKERRRRQNEHLRRLLTPKNALMVLNEIIPVDQVASVEASTNTMQYYKSNNLQSFCAELTVNGVTYKGVGETKMMARNGAAEQAIRDLILQRMTRLMQNKPSQTQQQIDNDEESTSESTEESVLPMIQLCSYALHKLFTEWEFEGHRVPQLKPNSSTSESESGGPKVKPPKVLPITASTMHPGMLLTYMRPMLEYRELPVQGNCPQNTLFTMAIEVDGKTFTGKAPNKKEARKLAAKAACEELFNVTFDI